MDKVSYALGLGIGRQLTDMGAKDLNIDDFAQAIKDVLAGGDGKLSETEAQTIVRTFFEEQEKKQRAAAAERFKDNKAKGEAYLKANGDKADGWYAALIAPIQKNVCHVKARYDVYRDRADWTSSKNQYELGVDYIFYKKVKAQVHYVWVNDRTQPSGKQNYNLVDCQVSVRF